MDEVEEIKQRIESDILDWCDEHIVGQPPLVRGFLHDHILPLVAAKIIGEYYRYGFSVRPINLRLEGNQVVWDGVEDVEFTRWSDLKHKRRNDGNQG